MNKLKASVGSMDQPIEVEDMDNIRRRRGLIYVAEDTILSMFQWRLAHTIKLPVFPQLPDADVLSVSYDGPRRAFVFLVTHKSLDVVPPGGEPPVLVSALVDFKFIYIGDKVKQIVHDELVAHGLIKDPNTDEVMWHERDNA